MVTTTDPAPDLGFTPPYAGQRITAAWQAAWDLMADGKPHHRRELVDAMHAAHDHPISLRTAINLCLKAVEQKYFVVTERDSLSRPTLRRADKGPT
jgi:hypothetical protein